MLVEAAIGQVVKQPPFQRRVVNRHGGRDLERAARVSVTLAQGRSGTRLQGPGARRPARQQRRRDDLSSNPGDNDNTKLHWIGRLGSVGMRPLRFGNVL
jgi:hypothetical protein